MAAPRVEVLPDCKSVRVTWQDNHVSTYHTSWLRYNCTCKICQQEEHVGCYYVDMRKFPDELLAVTVGFNHEENSLLMTIENDPYIGHVTSFDAHSLRELCYCDDCLEKKTKARNFVMKSTEKQRKIRILDFNDSNVDHDEFYFRWMKTIFEEGLCQVENFPLDDEAFLKAADTLGLIQITPFSRNGPIAEIVNFERDVINSSSNTSHELGFHMDYTYNECGGEITLHNCIKFDKVVTGGESVVADAFEAAEILRLEDPVSFKVLTQIPVYMENKVPKERYYQRSPLCITVDYYDQIVGVCMAGDYPCRLQVYGKDVDRFYLAYKKFMEILHREELEVQFRHHPNAVVCFDNRRMVHTRKAFWSNGGRRMIKVICFLAAITLVNTIFYAGDVSSILKCIWGAESKK